MAPTERTERTLEISANTPAKKAPFSERHPLIAGFGRGIAAGIFVLGASCMLMERPPAAAIVPHGVMPAFRNPNPHDRMPPLESRAPRVPAGVIVVPARSSPSAASSGTDLRPMVPLQESPGVDLMLDVSGPASAQMAPFIPIYSDGSFAIGVGVQSNPQSIDHSPNPEPAPVTFGPMGTFDISDR